MHFFIDIWVEAVTSNWEKKNESRPKKRPENFSSMNESFQKQKAMLWKRGRSSIFLCVCFRPPVISFYIFQRTHCITSFFIYYTITTYFQCIWISSDCAISNLKSLVISIRNSSDIFNTTNESTWKFEHHHDSFKIITFFKQLAVRMSKTNNTLWPFTRQPTHQVKFVDCTVYYYSSCVRYKREKDNSN